MSLARSRLNNTVRSVKEMNWWIITYFALFGMISLGGLWDDWCHNKPPWFLICSLFSTVVVGLLFAGFWYSGCHAILSCLAIPLFIAAAVWEVFQGVDDIRSLTRDPELSEKEDSLANAAGVILATVLVLPAFVVAGISAFE